MSMASRKKIKDAPVLKSWDELDLALKEIAECQLAVEAIDNKKKQKFLAITQEAKDKAQPYEDRVKELARHLKEFVTAHRDELDGKTKQLHFGKTGFRLSTRLILGDEDAVKAALRSLGMSDCIVVSETINKEVLKSYGEAEISRAGCTLQTVDTFWYETEPDKLRTAL